VKVMTLLGTRPEIIRLSRVIEALDRLCDHVLVHTGQNFDPLLSDVFFRELVIRPPDHYLGVRAETFGAQIGQILTASEEILRRERPDRLVILGDTNSALAAIVAKRLAIPVFHLEAGNRCFDDRVPEEVNRRVVDHSSDVLMPYTERSGRNLLREGIAPDRVFVIGNPIFEVLSAYEDRIRSSRALEQLGLEARRYFLVTMHREENVDLPERLRALVSSLQAVAAEYGQPVVCSVHPRTRRMLEATGAAASGDAGLRLLEPFGFPDFVALERSARCVITDSGTVQEECSIFGIPNVTIREVTERPETIEYGSNVVGGAAPEDVLRCVRTALAQDVAWNPPPEYVRPAVSTAVVKIVLGHYEFRHVPVRDKADAPNAQEPLPPC
jgi:UDP-N-acetylglucosamine 2-epimerase (non-hydrolysing)